MLPLCLMFLTFFLSRSGSFRALMTRAAADVLGCLLGYVFSDLLWGQTQRTDLGSERTCRTNLSSGDSDVNVNHLRRIELGRHFLRERKRKKKLCRLVWRKGARVSKKQNYGNENDSFMRAFRLRRVAFGKLNVNDENVRVVRDVTKGNFLEGF
ncbi:hypothetical protein G4B88_005282 [Cannabis sativa]|uniref:Secreted protein n=1 Tax=Cannabis sativa TaxID=3483 RepID=A0A7J6HAJ4_CANSA|nr:hypothetical protein G4B88_005282 [Cannabis sativa]